MFKWLFGPKKPDGTSPLTADDQLLRQRVVALRATLTEELGVEVIAKLLFLQYENQREPVYLRINSPGGSVIAGLAIIDTMKALAPPVRTQCEGVAHGIAAVILACGAKGERLVPAGSSLSLTPINRAENDTGADHDLDQVRLDLAAVIANATGRPSAGVAFDLLHGRFFDAAGAVEYGFADRVIETL